MVGCQAVDQTSRYGVRRLDAPLDRPSSGFGMVRCGVREGTPRTPSVPCGVRSFSGES